jgi:ankyrin repeat protein
MKLIHAFKSLVSHLNPFMEEDLTALTRACQVGNLNKVVKLLTKKQLRINPIPVESILTSAIMHGQVDIINYLLTSSNAKEFQKPDLRMAKLLESAAIHGQKEVITYFLLSDTDKYKMPQSKENIVLG